MEINDRNFPGDPNPKVTAFVIPPTSSSLTVPITTFTATDNKAVARYILTESSTPPSVYDTNWSTTAPASYTFVTPGTKTLYAWVKDNVGKDRASPAKDVGSVSNSLNASVTITLPADTTAPTVTVFTVPATSTSLVVSPVSIMATDAVGVTGYIITESGAAPLTSATGWVSVTSTTSYSTTTASYTASTYGAKTLYAWAKDGAGNVSTALVSAATTIALPNPATPDMAVWMGRWFKVNINVEGLGLSDVRHRVAGYLKVNDWDPVTMTLQGDLYWPNNSDAGQSWWSMSLPLHYVAGSNLDFRVWTQVAGEASYGFAARIKGKQNGGVLKSGSFKTAGGYYVQSPGNDSGSGNSAGWFKISGRMISDSKVPVEISND